jgi:hypothetical protein
MDSYVAERPTAAVERREHLFIAHVIPGDESNGPLAAAVTTFRG